MSSNQAPIPSMPNNERRRARVSGWIAIGSAMVMLLPWLLDMDGMDGGFAISFLAFFVALSAGVVALVFRGRAKHVDALLAGETLLGHWTCSGDAWQAYVEDEFAQKVAGGRGGVILIAAIALPIGALFWLFDREAGGWVFLTMVALVLLILLVAWGVPRLWRRRQRGARGGEVWLGETCAYYEGTLFRWTGFANELRGVEFVPATPSAPATLHLSTRSLQQTGWVPYELRLPLPDDRVDEAQGFVDKLLHRSAQSI